MDKQGQTDKGENMRNLIIILVAAVSLGLTPVHLKEEIPFEDMSIEERAEIAGLDVDEFVLFSSVVEAESDRNTEDTTGRRYIALVIINRMNTPAFHADTITEVLTTPGQFSTVRNGHSVTNRTDLSDLAVIEALEWYETGDAPEVLFFNCRWFFSGREPFPNPDGGNTIGGNYFSL